MVRDGTSLVPACNSSYGWNFSLGIRAHTTTNLRELKMTSGRGGWRCKQGASTDGVRVEIDGALMVLEGQSSMHTRIHKYTNTQGKEEQFYSITPRCGQTFWNFSHGHLPAHRRPKDSGETSLRSHVWLLSTSSVGMRSVTGALLTSLSYCVGGSFIFLCSSISLRIAFTVQKS